MYNSGHDIWAPEFLKRRPDVEMDTIGQFLHNLYRIQPDFVYSVSREFARSCQTPILVLPDDTQAHPYQVSMDIVDLSPRAKATQYPWNEPEESLVTTINQVREFLISHRPSE